MEFKSLEYLPGPNINITVEATADEVLLPDFMSANTPWQTMQDMLLEGGINTIDEAAGDHWDSFIAGHTRFNSMRELWDEAANYLARQLVSKPRSV